MGVDNFFICVDEQPPSPRRDRRVGRGFCQQNYISAAFSPPRWTAEGRAFRATAAAVGQGGRETTTLRPYHSQFRDFMRCYCLFCVLPLSSYIPLSLALCLSLSSWLGTLFVADGPCVGGDSGRELSLSLRGNTRETAHFKSTISNRVSFGGYPLNETAPRQRNIVESRSSSYPSRTVFGSEFTLKTDSMAFVGPISEKRRTTEGEEQRATGTEMEREEGWQMERENERPVIGWSRALTMQSGRKHYAVPSLTSQSRHRSEISIRIVCVPRDSI